jgi:hypothetical protein
MVKEIAGQFGLGDVSRPAKLNLDTTCDDWRVIYALLELHEATGGEPLTQLACRVADNILKGQTPTGLFPRSGRNYARTGDEAPLAILHLAAAIEGKQALMPPPTFDRRFFHCEYHGHLEERQKKRADARTYDHLVFYGDD